VAATFTEFHKMSPVVVSMFPLFWKKKRRALLLAYLGLGIVMLGFDSGSPEQLSASEASPHSGITITFTASPQIIRRGMNALLWWSVKGGASSCYASGGWSGEKPSSGSQLVSPSETTTYVLTCAGPGGAGSTSVTVSVGSTSSCRHFLPGAIIPSGFCRHCQVTLF
jgi:hypothetical protein